MHTTSDSKRLEARNRPAGPPVMYQSWRSLLFLHWRYDARELEHRLPPNLKIDRFDGSAWLGIVPFSMQGVHPRGLPQVGWLSNFLELNLRTYVVDEHGTPGVWFFSLDAERWPAVKLARWWFHLPYYWSKMSLVRDADDWIDYRSMRKGESPDRVCRYSYRGVGELFQAEPGTLEFFLAERYFLFTMVPKKGLCKGQVHHVPYPLQQAEVAVYDEKLFELNHLPKTGRPFDHALASPGVVVDVFKLTPCSR